MILEPLQFQGMKEGIITLSRHEDLSHEGLSNQADSASV